MPGQPFNSNSLLQTKFDALTSQLDRLTNFLEGQEQRQTKVAKEPAATLREQQAQRPIAGRGLGSSGPNPRGPAGRLRAAAISRDRAEHARTSGVVLPSGVDESRLPPETAEQRQEKSKATRQAFQEKVDALQQEAQDQTGEKGSKLRAMLGAAQSFAPGSPAPNKNMYRMPPGSRGGGGGAGGRSLGGMFNNPTGDPDDTGMLTWALLGEHGGPAFARNIALEQYGMQRSIGWAQNIAGNLSQSYDQSRVLQAMPGINPESLSALSGALQVAKDNPFQTYAAYKGLKMVGNAATQAGTNLADYQAAGQQFGYGQPAAIGQAFLGHRNALGNFGTAAQVGGAMNAETQALQGRIPGFGFGNGLTGQQAQDVTGTLAGQGFATQPESPVLSTLSSLPVIGGPLAGLLSGIFGGGPKGDAVNISENFMRPLMERFPGLKGDDLGQFTGSLRNSGTSIQQLTDQLDSMGVEARAAKETVGQFASSVSSAAKSFESLGSSPQGGYAIGTGFTNVTGKDPQFAGTLGQSPFVQGLAMSKYGILPSGLGDMNSGAFSNLSLASLQLLQHATAGLATNKYANVHGHQVLVQSGQQAQYDQIAQMTGLPSNVVKSMLGDQRGIAARAHAQQMLGDPANGTGFYQYLSQHKGKLTNDQYKYASQVWNDTVANTSEGTGISKKEMTRINHIKGLRDRAKAYAGDLANAAKDDAANQIQGTPNSQTVKVEFTGAAAKYFQQTGTGPSPSKVTAGAGGPMYNAVVNSQTGDLSAGGSRKIAASL